MSTYQYQISLGKESYQLESQQSQALSGQLNGQDYSLDLVGNAQEGYHLLLEGKSFRVQILEANYAEKSFSIKVNNEIHELKVADRFDLLLKDLGMDQLLSAAVNDLKAPMPGLVLSVKVQAGDTVKKGDALVVLEAMKMENVLKAEAEAKVKSIECEIGHAVEKNQVLIRFEVK